MPEPIFIKVGMYIMAPEPISNFTLSVPPLPNLFVIYAIRFVSKESRRLVLLRTSRLIRIREVTRSALLGGVFVVFLSISPYKC
jgi:hypothetical protein